MIHGLVEITKVFNSSIPTIDTDKAFKRFISVFFIGLFLLVVIFELNATNFIEAFNNPLEFRSVMSRGLNAFMLIIITSLIFKTFYAYLVIKIQNDSKLIGIKELFLVVILLLISPIFGSRGIVIGIIFFLLLIYSNYGKKLSLYFLIPFLFFSLITFIILGELRNILLTKEISEITFFSIVKDINFQYILTTIASRFDSFANFSLFLDRYNYHFILLNPESIEALPQQFIPRDYLPDKPMYFSSEMTARLMPEVFEMNTTYDFSGMAEAIFNFGWFFVYLPGILSGFVLAFLEKIKQEISYSVYFVIFFTTFWGLPSSLINNGFINTGNWVSLPIELTLNMLIFLLICYPWKLKSFK